MKNNISIITINYNNKSGLEKTIKSVKEQKSNIEYIVVDGDSNDGSKEIIIENQKHITHWLSESDLGIYDAMNKGVNLSKGEWLLFMNSGDVFHSKNIISRVLETISSDCRDNNIECIFGHAQLMEGEKIYGVQKFDLKKNRFIHQSVFYKKSLHKEYGLYAVDPKLTAADYFFISKLINNKKIKIFDEIVCNYQIGGLSDNIKTPVQTVFYDYISGRIDYIKLMINLLKIPTHRCIVKIKKLLMIFGDGDNNFGDK